MFPKEHSTPTVSIILLTAFVSLAILQPPALFAQTPLGTEFTYQGQLKDGGIPADGSYDLFFRLFDALTGGTQVGSMICVDNANIVDGLFTVQLDFVSGIFDGDGKWLEVEVRADNTPGNCREPIGYTTLAPRQPLTAAPYALYALRSGDGLWLANGDDISNINDGNVLIGEEGAPKKLQVTGINSVGLDGPLRITENEWSQRPARMVLDGNEINTWAEYPNPTTLFLNSDSAGNLQLANGGGNVGIGVSLPASKLDVEGTVSATAFVGDGSGLTNLPGGGGFWEANGDRIYNTNSGIVSIAGGTGLTRLAVSGVNSAGWDGPLRITEGGMGFSWKMVLDGNEINTWGTNYPDPASLALNGESTGDVLLAWGGGNVGIGVMSSPTTKLQVDGGTDTSPFGGGYLVLGDDGDLNISVDNNEIMARNNKGVSTLRLNHNGGDVTLVATGTGNVGIGTSNPSRKLQVEGGDVAIGAAGPGNLGIGFLPSARLHVVEFGDETLATFASFGNGDGVSIVNANGASTRTALVVDHANSSAVALRVRGIASVEVLEITGADLAEKFPTAERVEPGTVMEIDPDHPGQLRRARGAYNRRVAGVVSGAGDLPAGAILGNLPGNENAQPIALSGRVWVYCDASQGSVELGDLLTTSETPGHAMKAVDYAKAQGAIIGKAMSRLETGETGLVLVLVNLQ